jgi:hypothetical protein
MGKEPWKRSFAANLVAEEFLRLRHRLIPYLYSANYRTHTEGIPLCEPMYYSHDRDEAYEARNQYMFGSQLLVCPVTTPADKHLNLAKTRVWLPDGHWTDFFTGRIYQGGQWVDLHRDLNTIPVLAKEGAIVPMYNRADANDLSLEQPLDIHIWQGNGEFKLYEDDGETNSADCAITCLTLTETKEGLRFAISPAEEIGTPLPRNRYFNLIFRDITDAEVTVNGEPAGYSTRGIPVLVDPAERIIVELSSVKKAVNPPKEKLRTDLLTRVQGEVIWKNAVLGSTKKMPKFVRDALAELDALEY